MTVKTAVLFLCLFSVFTRSLCQKTSEPHCDVTENSISNTQSCQTIATNKATDQASGSDSADISSWLTSTFNSISSQLYTAIEPYIKGPLPAAPATETVVYPDDGVMSLEDMMATAKQMAAGFADSDIDMDLIDTIVKRVYDVPEEDIVKPEGENVYEYPPLYRMEPGQIGDVKYIEVEEGVKTKVITKAVNPPLFEIPIFLNDEECNFIIEKTKIKGLNESLMFGTKSALDAGLTKGIERVSYSSFLKINDTGKEFMDKLHSKVSKLIGMPLRVVQWSESLAIGMYKPGGHYYAHLDSNEAGKDFPCCFQKKCDQENGSDRETIDCCRLCRYVTVLYYLSDVEEGGETAFPFADLSLSKMFGKSNWANLTANCYESSVVIKPEKGKAIMWYNHFVDKNGYLSHVDKRSYHGGCDVIKGEKWIATNWISTPTYSKRYMPSKYRDIV